MSWGIGPGESHFQCVAVGSEETAHGFRVVGTRRLPLLQAGDASLPEPGALWLVLWVKLPLDRVDEILGNDLAAPALWKAGVVDKPHASLQAEGVGHAVSGDGGKVDGEVGFQLVGTREILIGVERVVGIDDDEVGVNVGALYRIQGRWGLVHGEAEGFDGRPGLGDAGLVATAGDGQSHQERNNPANVGYMPHFILGKSHSIAMKIH